MVNINGFAFIEIKLVGGEVRLGFFDALAFVYIEAGFEGAFSLVAAMVRVFLEGHRSIFHINRHMYGEKCGNLLSDLIIVMRITRAINRQPTDFPYPQDRENPLCFRFHKLQDLFLPLLPRHDHKLFSNVINEGSNLLGQLSQLFLTVEGMLHVFFRIIQIKFLF